MNILKNQWYSGCWIDAKENPPDISGQEFRHELTGTIVWPEFIVQIRGAKKATCLYFDGIHWYDELGEVYPVDYWMEMPPVPE